MVSEPQPELLQYALDSLEILRHSLALYDAGHFYFYRVMAVQLRLLLCDTTFRHGRHEEISLIPQLLPDLRLQPINVHGAPQLEVPSYPLSEWLDLPADKARSLTVRLLIRRVCDLDGGAHVDRRPLANSINENKTRQYIVSLTRYLLPVLTSSLEL